MDQNLLFFPEIFTSNESQSAIPFFVKGSF